MSTKDLVETLLQKLATLSRDATPREWAEAMHHLGDAYQERPRGDAAANLEAAIDAYEQALEVRTREAMPQAWAETTVNLATACSDRVRGDPSENLERAVALYEEALEVLSRDEAPIDRALALLNLGSAYSSRQHGDRAENVERAVALYHQALEVLTREETPVYWAAVMGNLGNAFCRRQRGDPAENVERAIEAYYQALEVETRERLPGDWAREMMNLGTAYLRRLRGDPAENIDDAIGGFRAALEVRTRKAMPLAWAEVMHNLGNGYVRRLNGDRAQNLELAILAFEQALEVRTRETSALAWAQTTGNLATAYLNRVRGDRAENVEKAIACYEQALEVQTRESLPAAWAATTMNLATAYRNRVRDDRADNLEKALSCCRQALRVRTRGTMPADWATTMMNLGIIYTNRIRGDRAANLELSIRSYEEALEVHTRETMPADWALTMMNLGTAYFYRVEGDPEDNLERALESYRATLEVRTRELMPVDWATSMMNLGSAYARRIAGDPEENVEAAIEAYEQALTVWTREAMPVNWSLVSGNVGSAYTRRLRGDRAENLEKALEVYRQVLEVRTHEALPIDWARTQANLGYVYAHRQRGDRAENAEAGIHACRQALEVLQPDLLPVNARRTARQLGALCAREGRWTDAADAYRQAVEATEVLYRAALLRSSREAELAAAPDLYRDAAYAVGRSGPVDEAAVILEQGRARRLGEALARDRANLGSLRREHPKIYADYLDATAHQRRFELAERSAGPQTSGAPPRASLEDLLESGRRAREAFDDVLGRIRAIPGYRRFLEPTNFADVAGAADRPLLYLVATQWGSLALLVHRRSPAAPDTEAFWEDGFTEDDLNDLLVERRGDQILGGYLPAQRGNWETFEKVLDTVLERLGERWLGRVASRLRALGTPGVVLIPGGRLGLLPLHAARYRVGGRERHLLDDLDVSYAPSARVLQTVRGQLEARSQAVPVLAGVANPRPAADPLYHARSELDEIAAFFDDDKRRLLAEATATKPALRAAADGASHVHLSCHGCFDPDQPLRSHVQLADTDLTLDEILDQASFRSPRLATLSACEAGIHEFHRLPDELIGLPAGFLESGVPGVVATLWKVKELSTALLMARFYRYHLEGDPETNSGPLTPSAALCRAQRWLRDVTTEDLRAELLPRRNQPSRGSRALASQVMTLLSCKNDEEQPFASAYRWAPFVFLGA